MSISMQKRKTSLALKRTFDLLGASSVLIITSPVLVAAGVAIRFSLGKPILFTQTRPGYKAQPFTIYKLKTMRDPQKGEVWFRSDEQRLTNLGRWLRKLSIDELPELWNVLKGEMSLVGPRPLLMDYLEKYTKEENRRHNVKPGITGWAQVNGRQDLKFSERLALDVWYADNWSLALDLRILFMTMAAVWQGAGVHSGQNVDDVDDIGLSSDRERNPT